MVHKEFRHCSTTNGDRESDKAGHKQDERCQSGGGSGSDADCVSGTHVDTKEGWGEHAETDATDAFASSVWVLWIQITSRGG